MPHCLENIRYGDMVSYIYDGSHITDAVVAGHYDQIYRDFFGRPDIIRYYLLADYDNNNFPFNPNYYSSSIYYKKVSDFYNYFKLVNLLAFNIKLIKIKKSKPSYPIKPTYEEYKVMY